MAGRPRKSSEMRQGRGTADVVPAADGVYGTAVPEPPQKLTARGEAAWEGFWKSSLASAVDVTVDGFLLVRWITYLEEWLAATRTIKREGLTVTGSTGNMVLHPVAKHRRDLELSLSQIEGQLGLTPKARAQLGLAINQFERSAQDVLGDVSGMEAEPLDDAD